MNRLPLEPDAGGGRFPGFSVMSQVGHWDDATAAVVTQRRCSRAPVSSNEVIVSTATSRVPAGTASNDAGTPSMS